jgi:hypothetical protein
VSQRWRMEQCAPHRPPLCATHGRGLAAHPFCLLVGIVGLASADEFVQRSTNHTFLQYSSINSLRKCPPPPPRILNIGQGSVVDTGGSTPPGLPKKTKPKCCARSFIRRNDALCANCLHSPHRWATSHDARGPVPGGLRACACFRNVFAC